MKVSLNWLSDYVDVAMPAEALADLFLRIGFPCEQIEQTETDLVLDLEITSNRPDLLGHLGVARELAAATGAAFRPPAPGEPPTAGRAADLTAVEVREPALCPRYTARVIRGATIAPSPRWLAERLEAVGLRAVNNVVDVTNYVLMEYAQPLHSFDHDKLAEGRIVVRRAAGGEMLVSIDGTKCRLDEEMLIIADADRPVAVAGVMGGLDTEVSEGTRNLLIESAQFDPLVTRRTARKLQLMSESNYRFERGVDPVGVDAASRRACQLIVELAGGELAEGVVDVWAEPFRPRTLTLRCERTDRLLGLSIPPERQVQILEALGLSPQRDGGRITCTIPPHRADLTREADLIEEVARLEGYDRIPVHRRIAVAVVPEHPQERLRRQVRAALAAVGFDEAVTIAFVHPDEARLFGQDRPVRVDPLHRKTHNALRASLLPSLLAACKTNQDAGNAEVSLYELAAVFPPGRGELPDEHRELAMVTTGDLRQLRGALEAVIARAAASAPLGVEPCEAPGFAAGAAAAVALDGRRIGLCGQIAPAALDYYGLEHPIAAAAVDFEALAARAGQTPLYRPVPKYPPVQRDLSLIVDDRVTWGELQAALDAVRQPMRVGLDYVTTFRGRPIAAGRKSVTVRLTYRGEAGTLRSEQVDGQVAEVVEHLRRTLGAELRR
jgi:phenylalanyl-tRNA synthetase beta chain